MPVAISIFMDDELTEMVQYRFRVLFPRLFCGSTITKKAGRLLEGDPH